MVYKYAVGNISVYLCYPIHSMSFLVAQFGVLFCCCPTPLPPISLAYYRQALYHCTARLGYLQVAYVSYTHDDMTVIYTALEHKHFVYCITCRPANN